MTHTIQPLQSDKGVPLNEGAVGELHGVARPHHLDKPPRNAFLHVRLKTELELVSTSVRSAALCTFGSALDGI